MFNTLAYYLGYGDVDEVQQADADQRARLENTPAADFNITTEEDGWGLVEKVLMQKRQQRRGSSGSSVRSDVNSSVAGQFSQFPPPSPPSESSWIVTPPPCFDAEIDKIVLESFEQCERENLMIEHPSIFVANLTVVHQQQPAAEVQDENSAPASQEVATTRAPGAAKRSQRRASRQVLKSKAQQKKRSCVQKPLKQKSQNRNFNKMRLIVQQPRKHY